MMQKIKQVLYRNPWKAIGFVVSFFAFLIAITQGNVGGAMTFIVVGALFFTSLFFVASWHQVTFSEGIRRVIKQFWRIILVIALLYAFWLSQDKIESAFVIIALIFWFFFG